MLLSTWLTYLVVSLICVLTPGPGVLFAISNSVRLGWQRAIYSSFGNIFGLFCVSSLTMTGLGALLKTSALMFTVLKVIGGGYLIYLGVRQFRSKENLFMSTDATTTAEHSFSSKDLFLKGVLVAITNPKAIMFFSALFPQFIKTDAALVPQFFILTSTFMVLSFSSLMIYALSANSAKRWFSQAHHAMWFNRTSGSLFVLLGMSLFKLKNKQA